MKGPKPRPASSAMKNVEVARPNRCGGVNLTAIASTTALIPFRMLHVFLVDVTPVEGSS